MKISKSKLIQMIKEEMMNEDDEFIPPEELEPQSTGMTAKNELDFLLGLDSSIGFDQASSVTQQLAAHIIGLVGANRATFILNGAAAIAEEVLGEEIGEETIEVADVEEPEEEAVRTTTPAGTSHRRMRGQQRTTDAKLSPETLRMIDKND